MAPALFDLPEKRMVRSRHRLRARVREAESMSTDPPRWTPAALLLIALLCASHLGFPIPSADAETGVGPVSGNSTLNLPRSTDTPPSLRAAPQKAYELLQRLEKRDGSPLPGYVGGREFQNRERRLPRGRYREYDVNPKIRGRSRDAERIVIEQRTGKAYYTGDHYQTFIPLN
jgi:guanyl-specific ribonuclease Sa